MPDDSFSSVSVADSADPPNLGHPALRGIGMALAVAGTLLVLTLLARADSLAHDPLLALTPSSVTEEADPVPLPSPAETFVPRELASHPDNRYEEYVQPSGDADSSSLEAQFRELLDLFEKRQGKDTNFTIRVFDNRTGRTLEIYEMDEYREAYEQGESVDWREIDDERRELTTELVDKYEDIGYPRDHISVRWGRAQQVRYAHHDGLPILEYEKQLADHLGLSLLPTQISTVETFNQDELISNAGARSRYQLMPTNLRRGGVNTYTLPTANGPSVEVRDELHPLLVLEPAFTLMRGYINAVGHEIPGISAYHTGPGNIYTLYRTFLTEADEHVRPTSSVMDAYMWGVTEGFETISSRSTFGPHSRGYVAAAYGTLRATDTLTVNTRHTLRAARVQLERGASIKLDDLLTALAHADYPLDWGVGPDDRSLYERFKHLNAHMDLPDTPDGSIPEGGNIELMGTAPDGSSVRFFLPLEAPDVLAAEGVDVLNDAATFRFDENTFTDADAQRTHWDDAYDELVRDIKHFGFTTRNRNRLMLLYQQFKELAEENPSHFRRRQLRIIETHRRIWMSGPWSQLAETTQLAFDQPRITNRPPMLRDLDIPVPEDLSLGPTP